MRPQRIYTVPRPQAVTQPLLSLRGRDGADQIAYDQLQVDDNILVDGQPDDGEVIAIWPAIVRAVYFDSKTVKVDWYHTFDTNKRRWKLAPDASSIISFSTILVPRFDFNANLSLPQRVIEQATRISQNRLFVT